MTSIYDRLAAQGTASSRVRAKIEQEERRQQEEKRKRDRKARTPAKNPGKLQVMGLGEPQDPKRIVTSPKQMSNLCDRLYKQDTASSKAHHAPVNTPQKATSPRRVTAPLPRVAALPSAQDKDNLSSPIAIRMKILIRTKEQKKNGEGYGDLNLSNPEVRRQINLFHAGKSSAKSLAYDVMNALFFRDCECTYLILIVYKPCLCVTDLSSYANSHAWGALECKPCDSERVRAAIKWCCFTGGYRCVWWDEVRVLRLVCT